MPTLKQLNQHHMDEVNSQAARAYKCDPPANEGQPRVNELVVQRLEKQIRTDRDNNDVKALILQQCIIKRAPLRDSKRMGSVLRKEIHAPNDEQDWQHLLSGNHDITKVMTQYEKADKVRRYNDVNVDFDPCEALNKRQYSNCDEPYTEKIGEILAGGIAGIHTQDGCCEVQPQNHLDYEVVELERY